MSTLEICLKEIGVLEAVLHQCTMEGKSLQQLIRDTFLPDEGVARDLDTPHYECTAGDVERFHRMLRDPEYRAQLREEDRDFFGGREMSVEEARELCQD